MTFPYESREPEPVASTLEACILTGDDRRSRAAELRERFAPGILEVEPIDHGRVYWFERSEMWLQRLVEFVSFESECCPHLDFGIGMQAGGRLISLRVTSASEASEFEDAERELGVAEPTCKGGC